MKYCIKCGTQINENTKFCPTCGAPNETVGNTAGQGYNQYTQTYGHTGYSQGTTSTNGLAIASLVLGICSFIFGWFIIMIPGILAIIFGGIAMKQCNEKKQAGRGLAIAGLILGIIALIIYVIIFIVTMSALSYSALYYGLF